MAWLDISWWQWSCCSGQGAPAWLLDVVAAHVGAQCLRDADSSVGQLVMLQHCNHDARGGKSAAVECVDVVERAVAPAEANLRAPRLERFEVRAGGNLQVPLFDR